MPKGELIRDISQEFKEKMDIIYSKIDFVSSDKTNDFSSDFTAFSSIVYDGFENYAKEYWPYFIKKYDLPELIEYFSTYNELMGFVFVTCIQPFDNRLDVLSDSNTNYSFRTTISKTDWNIRRFFSNNWISIFSFIVMIITFQLASNEKAKNSFEYDIYISLFTSFLISIIVSSINKSHKKRLSKRIYEISKIVNEFTILEESYIRIQNIIIDEVVLENSIFVTEFCTFNNALEKFIRKTKSFDSINTIEVFHRLKEFEKEIFSYSSSIVKKDFIKYRMDQTTDDEVMFLKQYVIEFGYWFSEFKSELETLSFTYSNDISKMESKSL